jgi:hypothetical protein
MLFIVALTSLGLGRLNSVLPWPLVCLLAVVIIFTCCIALTGLLARTPLAVPLTGRKQEPWSTLIPGRRPLEQAPAEQAFTDQVPSDQAPAADQPQPEPETADFPQPIPGFPDLPFPDPATLVGTTRDKNGS